VRGHVVAPRIWTPFCSGFRMEGFAPHLGFSHSEGHFRCFDGRR
jgi:hypothetical protein